MGPFRLAAGPRRPLLRLLAVLLASGPGMAAAQTPAMLHEPVPPVRLMDHVYYVGTRGISSFLLTSPKGHVLIDAGFVSTVPKIRASMAKLGFRLEDVKLILVGHAHMDHVAGLADIVKVSGARVVVGRGDADAVEQGDPSSDWLGTPVSRRVGDGDTVAFGPWRFTAHATPGHTKGCTTWSTTLSDHGRRIPSLFVCSTSVPGGTVLVGNREYPEIADDYARTFLTLEALPCEAFFEEHPQGFRFAQKAEALRAHPGVNPFVDPEGCRRTIAEEKANFEKALARQRDSTKAATD